MTTVTTVTTGATTMTEPPTTPTAAERVAALRARRVESPPTRPGRERPAQAAKILTAGLASTSVLALTAAYGWTAQAADSGVNTAPVSVAAPGALDPAFASSSVGLVIVDPSTGQVLSAVPVTVPPVVIDAAPDRPIVGSSARALPAVPSTVVVPVPVPAPVPPAPSPVSQATSSGS